MIVYHNNQCSKSRSAIEFLKEKNQNFETITYLTNPISKEELIEILRKLNMSAFDLIRKNEAIFKEQFKGQDLSESEWIDVMLKHPKLIERPIIVKGNRAVIGRPTEKILELL